MPRINSDGVKMARLRSKRRGPGICPVSMVLIRAPPGAGILRSEIGKALEGAGARGYTPY